MAKTKEEEKKTTTFIIWPLLAGVLISVLLWKRAAGAQTATLFGIVTDANSDPASPEPIDGVEVAITGSEYRGITNDGGAYIIENITPGTYPSVVFTDPQGRYEPLTVEEVG